MVTDIFLRNENKQLKDSKIAWYHQQLLLHSIEDEDDAMFKRGRGSGGYRNQ